MISRKDFIAGTTAALALQFIPAWAKDMPPPLKIRRPDANTAAICGLFCGTCPSYPEQCHGCLSDKLTGHCVECPNGFRKCAKEHGVVRCYECTDYPCEKLQAFTKTHVVNGIGHHANVIKDLNYMREHGVEQWVEMQTRENACPQCERLILWYDKNSHSCS